MPANFLHSDTYQVTSSDYDSPSYIYLKILNFSSHLISMFSSCSLHSIFCFFFKYFSPQFPSVSPVTIIIFFSCLFCCLILTISPVAYHFLSLSLYIYVSVSLSRTVSVYSYLPPSRSPSLFSILLFSHLQSPSHSHTLSSIPLFHPSLSPTHSTRPTSRGKKGVDLEYLLGCGVASTPEQNARALDVLTVSGVFLPTDYLSFFIRFCNFFFRIFFNVLRYIPYVIYLFDFL
jgi:hypothetical protein